MFKGGVVVQSNRFLTQASRNIGAIMKRYPRVVNLANIAQMAFGEDSAASRRTIDLLLQQSKIQEMNRTYLMRKLNPLRTMELNGKND